MTAELDEAGKARVKQALIARLEAALRASDTRADSEHDAAEIVQDSAQSTDDVAQSYEAGDLAGLFEQSADHVRDQLDRARALDVSVAGTVGPGAIIVFDGDRYLVGVTTEPFDCDGVEYQGLSTDSPVYAAISGLRAGETFRFRDADHRLDSVS